MSTYKAEDGTWTYECPGVPGDACGPFVSSGWPTKKLADARGTQHKSAHTDKAPMQELHDFRVEHNLVVHDDGSVHVGED